ncbi:hypothetical protein K2D_46310 [Planctomycetes bacterium K2D]|uniref:Uncharacterized protein n=1 Tax=Botrimarina mediterranea TaxID=2528022 RepID=A0A518KF28_9BACT|nr:hypothetical protein Spa11_46300 [Botrimarina mediterranea]QDV80996.1 hypothetical protein K2D_46310 [Planctomycetes bacterium K2D]
MTGAGEPPGCAHAPTRVRLFPPPKRLRQLRIVTDPAPHAPGQPAPAVNGSHAPRPQTPVESPADARRRRLTEAKRQFDRYIDLGAYDPALALHRQMTAAGEGWRIDPQRLQPLVDFLRGDKRYDEATPLLVDLIEQLQQRVNNLRLTLAQVAVKKVDEPQLAIDTLVALDHRLLTTEQRDIAIEMQGRARRRQIEGTIGPQSEIR